MGGHFPLCAQHCAPTAAMDSLYLDDLVDTLECNHSGVNPTPSPLEQYVSGDLSGTSQGAENSGVRQRAGPESGGGEEGGEAKPKDARNRTRTVFTEKQKRKLMQRFQRHQYISPQDRTQLADALGLNSKQVKTWYQNRRMKIKRSQYCQNRVTSWNQKNFNSMPAQTLSTTQAQASDMMKCHFHNYGQEPVVFSNQALTFGRQEPSWECGVNEVFQLPSIQREYQNASTSSNYQNSQLPNYPDPHFGSFHDEHLVFPEMAPPGFRNQFPRSGVGHAALGYLQLPSIQDELQYAALSSGYPPIQGDHMAPLEAEGRGMAGSSQDAQTYQNNWCSVQSGPSSVYMMLTPKLDACDTEPIPLAESLGQGFVG